MATHKTWTCTCVTAHMQTAGMAATHGTMRQGQVHKLLFTSLDLVERFTKEKKSFDVGQSDITARYCHRTYCHKSLMQYSDKGGRMVSSCSLQR